MNKKQLNRLSISYLLIIMAMSMIFSIAIYAIIVAQQSRPLPRFQDASMRTVGDNSVDAQTVIDERDANTRYSVIISLVGLNAGVLIVGIAFSRYLAVRTLRPIEAAMNAQVQFVSDASHELRTPLTALLTTNEVALRKKTMDNAKIREVLSKNIMQIENLQELSSSLLQLADSEETESKKSPRREVYIDELIQDITASFSARIATKKITCAVSADHQAYNIPINVVRQIVTILIDNAIKYSYEGGTVTVQAFASKQQLIIHVKDEGMGIDVSDQAKIFDRFYRSDSARTRSAQSGHGLGLAIAKGLANANNCYITVTSQPGKGSQFSVIVQL